MKPLYWFLIAGGVLAMAAASKKAPAKLKRPLWKLPGRIQRPGATPASPETTRPAGRPAGGGIIETIKEKVEDVVTPVTERVKEAVSALADRAAGRAKLDPAVVQAIMDVESGRYGVDAVRFEPHMFHRYNTVGHDKGNTREAYALKPRQAKNIHRVPWTPEDGDRGISRVSSETNYAAFQRAYAVDPWAAVTATSWGAFQVTDPTWHLGVTYKEFMRRWLHEDRAQLSIDLLVGWIKHYKNAREAAQAAVEAGGDPDTWIPFVEQYNGPKGVTVNRYHEKLAAAYARYA